MADLRVTSGLKAALLVLTVSSLAAAAQAQSATGAAPRATSVVHIPGVATFDWLAKKGAGRAQTDGSVQLSSDEGGSVRQSRFFGRGSWICSPAGFGKRSTCFAR